MTCQEMWEGLQAVERCESLADARELVRDLLGRMDREELAVVARAVAHEVAPEDVEAMDPEDAEAWREWREALGLPVPSLPTGALGASLAASETEVNNHKPRGSEARQTGAGSL